jgi:hypothetical protein
VTSGVRAFGRDISVAAIGGALAVALVAVAVLLWKWHGAIFGSIGDAWSWLGSDAAVPHWLLLLLILVAIAGAAVIGLALVARREEPVVEPPPIAEAEQFREAYDGLLAKFVEWREELVVREMEGQNSWLNEYRDLRREAFDAFVPIRLRLRAWLNSIDEHWTYPWKGEPTWHDIDGPDESIESVIDKFFMPITLTEALDFWKEWDNGDLHQLVAARVDLIDSFIRSLKRPHDPEADLVFVRSRRERVVSFFRRR